MRLDAFLYERGFTASRNEAKNLILSGCVSVGGKTVKKPAFDVADGEESVLLCRPGDSFVSRGGKKLQGALDAFGIDPKDRLCIDIGASSGGFTDCLLKHGAGQVLAVDSGSGQLADAIRSDPRVLVYENYNARYLLSEDFPYAPDLAVMDVSFISATLILPALYEILSYGADFVLLIKPQFEVGRAHVGKGGIVKDEKARAAACKHVIAFAENVGFVSRGCIPSPITGGDGNVEYLAYFTKG